MVTQGDVVSPTLFNLVIDMVMRNLQLNIQLQEGISNPYSGLVFYTDDGYIGGTNQSRVQHFLNLSTHEFQALGLATNAFKTKVLISYAHSFWSGVSLEGYLWLYKKISHPLTKGWRSLSNETYVTNRRKEVH